MMRSENRSTKFQSNMLRNSAIPSLSSSSSSSFTSSSSSVSNMTPPGTWSTFGRRQLLHVGKRSTMLLWQERCMNTLQHGVDTHLLKWFTWIRSWQMKQTWSITCSSVASPRKRRLRLKDMTLVQVSRTTHSNDPNPNVSVIYEYQ